MKRLLAAVALALWSIAWDSGPEGTIETDDTEISALEPREP